MKKLISILTGAALIIISLTWVFLFMQDGYFPAGIRMLKSNLCKGGIIYNNTSKDMEIVCDSYVSVLPAHKNSAELGIKDADAVIIRENKVLKFCDLGIIELTQGSKGEITVREKGLTWICRLANDYKVYDSVKKAFNQ